MFIYIYIYKKVDTCMPPRGMEEVPTHFSQRFLTSKNILSTYRSKHRHFLFHVERHMSVLVVWFVTGWSPPPTFSLSVPKNHSFTIFVIGISTSILIFLMFFFLDPFVKVLFIFNFIIKFQFTKYYIFRFHPYSFAFKFFFPLTFCKSFIGF